MTGCAEMSFSSIRTHLSGTAIALLFHPPYIFCLCFVLLFLFILFIFVLLFIVFVWLFCSILRTYFDEIQWMEYVKQFIPCKNGNKVS